MPTNNTYTFKHLKQCVYKALDEYTKNGELVPTSDGILADIDKRFISTLNICARRVFMSLPKLQMSSEITFISENGKVYALLPENFYEKCGLIIYKKGEIPNIYTYINDGKLYCEKANENDSGLLSYTCTVNSFSENTADEEIIRLPDISVDALIYLTAAELCPADYSELYARLLYNYRDIALNCYNVGETKKSRNSFYSTGKKRKKLIC